MKQKKLDFDEQGCQITYYTLSTVINGYVENAEALNENFTQDQLNIMSRLEPGNKLYFEKIIITKPSGEIIYYPAMVYKIIK